MSVGARAGVTGGIEGVGAQRAGGTSGLDERGAPYGDGGGLLSRDCASADSGALAELFAYLVDRHRFFDLEDDLVTHLVVAGTERTGHPVDLERGPQFEVVGKVPGRGEVFEQLAEISSEGGNLLLLDLQREHLGAFGELQQEQSATGLADYTDGEVVDLFHMERLAHDWLSSWRCVAPTVSTDGASA